MEKYYIIESITLLKAIVKVFYHLNMIIDVKSLDFSYRSVEYIMWQDTHTICKYNFPYNRLFSHTAGYTIRYFYNMGKK